MLPTFLNRLANEASLRTAVAGDGLGNLFIAARPHWMYARLGSSDGPICEVHTSIIQPNENDFILIERENPNRMGGWRMAFWLRAEADDATGAPIFGAGGLTTVLLIDDDSIQLQDDDAIDLTS